MSLPPATREAFSTVIDMRPGGSALPLFIIHGVGGTLPECDPLLDRLDPEHPVYGVIAQTFDPAGPVLLSLEELASRYLKDIRKVVSHGPYGLVGFSFGGMIAFEIAQQLRAEGCPPPVLIMLDSTEMSRHKRQAKTDSSGQRIRDLSVRLRRRFQEAFERPDTLSYIKGKFTSRSYRLLYSLTSNLGLATSKADHDPYHVNWFAAVNYNPKPYDERWYLFKARDHYWGPRTPYDLGWGPFAAKGLDVIEIPCDHVSLFVEPAISVLAGRFRDCLRSVSPVKPDETVASGVFGDVSHLQELPY